MTVKTISQQLKVLLIEDDPDDAGVVRESLAKDVSACFTIECVDRLYQGLKRLSEGDLDVVLLDLSLPDGQGMEAVTSIREQFPDLPLVVLADRTDEPQALEALRHGAKDYLLKGYAQDKMLPRLTRYAIERQRAEKILRDTQERLRAENKRLKELVMLKDEFVAKVSHELRTPLTAIKEGISLVLDEALGQMTAEQKDFLSTVDENIDRLTELISNMLDLSKIEAGRLRLLRHRVALHPLIDTTLASYRAMAGRRTVKIELAAVADVFADPHRLLQVLGNLLANAIKFTKEEGTITLALQERHGSVEVSIQDDGIGIAKEDLPKLFQKFSQVGRPEGGPQGSGLGLALCKELVELHQGRIRVVSQPGKGSTFTMTLPVYTADFALQESFKELIESASETQEDVVGLIVLDSAALLRELSDFLSVPQRAHGTKPVVQGQGGRTPTPRERLDQLAELVRTSLHRSDVVLGIEPHWVVILVVADANGVQAVVQRLRRALPERLRYRWETLGAVARRLPLKFGAAVYPADGADARTLFAKATASLNCGLTALEPAATKTG